jgi:hypothetical protein
MYFASELAPLLWGTVSLLCGILLLAPFVASTLLSIRALKELMAICEKLSQIIRQNLKIGSFSVGAIVTSVAAIVLGLCWRMAMPTYMLYPAAAIVALCILASYIFMTAFIWIVVPLGFYISNKNRSDLKDDFRTLYLIFVAASIPLGATAYAVLTILLVSFTMES